MQRKIKFKVFCKRHNREEIYTLGELICGFATTEDGEGGIFENWREYTGLKDKNGKEIYEGDIIKFYDSKYEVFFKEERGGFSPFANDGGCGCCCDIDSCNNDDCEVIGNIYNNPELLEKENN